APGGDGDAIWTHRFAVGEENRNGDVRVMVGVVEDACGFVGNQLAVGIGAFRGDIALWDCPSPASNGLHIVPRFPSESSLVSHQKMITPSTRFSLQSGGTFFAVLRRRIWQSALGAPTYPRRRAPPAAAATANRGSARQRCVQSPFCPVSPAPRGSRRSVNRRSPMALFQCAPWRWGCAGPIAKFSMAAMALLLRSATPCSRP